MGSGKNWTKNEVQYLINNWELKTDAEIAVELKRPIEGIISKRKRLGFYRSTKKYSFQDVINEFSKTDYELLSDRFDYYDAAQNTLKYICPRHRDKGVQTISLGHLQQGRGCYYCGRERTIAGHISDLNDNRYDKLCESKGLIHVDTKRIDGIIYVGYKCPIHPDTGVQYSRFHNMNRTFKNNFGCPICHSSKWENEIRDILNTLGVPFEAEKKFKNLKDKTYLRFDFYIPILNKIIEYDGIHHYSPFCFNGTSLESARRSFNDTQRRDQLKDDYCKQNHIPMLRIPYYEFNNAMNLIIDFLS